MQPMSRRSKPPGSIHPTVGKVDDEFFGPKLIQVFLKPLGLFKLCFRTNAVVNISPIGSLLQEVAEDRQL